VTIGVAPGRTFHRALTLAVTRLYHGRRPFQSLMRSDSPSSSPFAARFCRGRCGSAGESGLCRSIFAVLCAIAVSALGVNAQSVDQVTPQVKAAGYVTDLAGVLSQSTREQLTALCTEVDQKAQAQVAVVVVKSLEGRPIEDYSIDLATRLGIGPKSTNR
jgi:hypothetical protein